MITSTVKRKIQTIVSVFETSSLKGNYAALVVLSDGPRLNGTRQPQITYGKHQTTESGNLKTLIQLYCKKNGKYIEQLKPYLPIIGIKPLADDTAFKKLLKVAAIDPIMQEMQDVFFDQYYWDPAQRFFLVNGFKLPLSMLVIYDSYIHSGGVPSWIRDDFAQVPPIKGGNEKEWTTAYVTCRDHWLENHSDKILRNTDYRTDCFLEQIRLNNWELSQEVTCKFNSSNLKDWFIIK
jgi:chitosanase